MHALPRELQKDPKDRAENIMIADLMRNDLSKICKDYSIREDTICELMTLSRVHHLVSRISGELCDDVALTDIFPGAFSQRVYYRRAKKLKPCARLRR